MTPVLIGLLAAIVVALVVVGVVAYPHLRAGAPLLSPEGERLAREARQRAQGLVGGAAEAIVNRDRSGNDGTARPAPVMPPVAGTRVVWASPPPVAKRPETAAAPAPAPARPAQTSARPAEAPAPPAPASSVALTQRILPAGGPAAGRPQPQGPGPAKGAQGADLPPTH